VAPLRRSVSAAHLPDGASSSISRTSRPPRSPARKSSTGSVCSPPLPVEPWYYTHNGQQAGPLGLDALQRIAAAGQLAVFGSQPGEPTYSPIWKETILTWKASATPVLIKSDTQINQLEKKGVLTERATSTRLNCPIVKVGKA